MCVTANYFKLIKAFANIHHIYSSVRMRLCLSCTLPLRPFLPLSTTTRLCICDAHVPYRTPEPHVHAPLPARGPSIGRAWVVVLLAMRCKFPCVG